MVDNKIAVCFGGYCPMHRGHLDVIMKAKKSHSHLFLVVCGYLDEPRSLEINLSLAKRFDIIEEMFKFDDSVTVIKIADDELGLDQSCSPANWVVWTEDVFKKITETAGFENVTKKDLVYYVAEDSYFNELYENLKYNTYLCEKSIPVSGTLIRENPVKYWDYIAYPFREHMTKNILVIGTASEGKTTLCQDISRYFGIPIMGEYGRFYMAELKMDDTQLTISEFKMFLKNQYRMTKDLAVMYDSPLTIVDTDALVTLMYAYAYSEMSNMSLKPGEHLELEKYAINHGYINPDMWQKIYVVKPASENFVDDGIRYMGQASMAERKKNFLILETLIEKYYPSELITYLNGGEYKKNFDTVKNYINKLYNA